MAASWFHPRDLPPVYRALLDPERELPDDVYLMASLPNFGARWAALLVVLPISGFWVLLSLQNLLRMGKFSELIEVLFWTISAIGAAGFGFKSIESIRYAMRARVDHRHGRWRFGVFMHKEWLLVRHEETRVLLIPKTDVSRVSEQVSANGRTVEPLIDLGDSSISNHPVWKQVWGRIEDANSADRMKDWFQGRQFNWFSGQGCPPPIVSDNEQDSGTHIPSLPPHKPQVRTKDRGVPQSAFLSLEHHELMDIQGRSEVAETPTLVPKTPSVPPSRQETDPKSTSNRKVAPRPAPIDPGARPIPPTPIARNRIREVLAHAVQSTKLDLSGCRLSSVPADILRVPHLTYLDLSNNNLDRIPNFISDLPMLEVLDISSNLELGTLPVSIGRLNHLRHVQADLTGFIYFPWELAICRALTHVVLPGEPFDDHQRGEITSLLPYVKIEFVGASHEEQDSVSTPFQQLIQQADEDEEAVSINLARQELTQLDIASLSHSRVVSLNASHNQLQSIGEEISELRALQVLLLDNNDLRALPESLCDLDQLEWISVTNNNLTALPQAIGRLNQISQLIVYGNKFPDEEQLRIQALFPDLDIVF
jgi:Leucine-rich repeat (LRR) protein